MGASLSLNFFLHDLAFLFKKDLKKSTMADRSLKEYPQWGQQRRLQFFERRHPEHFISPSMNSFPQRGQRYDVDFVIMKVTPFSAHANLWVWRLNSKSQNPNPKQSQIPQTQNDQIPLTPLKV
jgi:hypothetical protein